MARRILLVVGAVLALGCAGTALYAAGQPAEFKCLAHEDLHPGDTGYHPVPGDADYRPPPGESPADARLDAIIDQRLNNEGGGPCSLEDAPLPILRSGAGQWWWFGGAAVMLLTLAAVPLALPRRSAG